MVSQSISVFFFLLKNQEAFFRNEGRPLAREKSPLVNERSSFQFFSVVRYFFRGGGYARATFRAPKVALHFEKTLLGFLTKKKLRSID